MHGTGDLKKKDAVTEVVNKGIMMKKVVLPKEFRLNEKEKEALAADIEADMKVAECY